jgi:hypothetical protein
MAFQSLRLLSILLLLAAVAALGQALMQGDLVVAAQEVLEPRLVFL